MVTASPPRCDAFVGQCDLQSVRGLLGARLWRHSVNVLLLSQNRRRLRFWGCGQQQLCVAVATPCAPRPPTYNVRPYYCICYPQIPTFPQKCVLHLHLELCSKGSQSALRECSHLQRAPSGLPVPYLVGQSPTTPHKPLLCHRA